MKYKYESDRRQMNFRLSEEACNRLIAMGKLSSPIDRKQLNAIVKDLVENHIIGESKIIPVQEEADLASEIQDVKQQLEDLSKFVRGKFPPQAA